MTGTCKACVPMAEQIRLSLYRQEKTENNIEFRSAAPLCQQGYLLFAELFPPNIWLLLSRTAETQFCNGGWNSDPYVEWGRPQSTSPVVHVAVPKQWGWSSGGHSIWLFPDPGAVAMQKNFRKAIAGTWKRMVIRDTTICRESGAAPAGHIIPGLR